VLGRDGVLQVEDDRVGANGDGLAQELGVVARGIEVAAVHHVTFLAELGQVVTVRSTSGPRTQVCPRVGRPDVAPYGSIAGAASLAGPGSTGEAIWAR